MTTGPNSSPWHVLIVDDEPEAQVALQAELARIGSCDVLPPEDVQLSDLRAADLVLVDLRLDNVQRDPGGPTAIANEPLDGLALTAVLRSHVEKEGRRPLFALHTGHIDLLTPDLPGDIGEHVAARLNNLEWVFRKTDPATSAALESKQVKAPLVASHLLTSGPSLPERVAALAAVADTSTEWGLGPETVEDGVASFLAIPESATWFGTAYRDVRGCHPPLFELAADTDGLAFLRWMLHRILPYPCFLLDSHRLALRLRIDHSELGRLLTASAPFAGAFDGVRYRGALAGFVGPRWWRAGVESTVFEFTGGDLFDLSAMEQKLNQLAGRELRYMPPGNVINIGANYQPISVGPRSQSVRISPDDWPPFADQAFASVNDARTEGSLRRLVVVDDLPLIEETKGGD